MAQPLPPSPKKMSKNVKIAIVVIPVIFVALIAGVMMGLMANQTPPTNSPTPSPTVPPLVYSTSTPTATPISFSLSFAPTSYEEQPIMQGSSEETIVTLSSFYSNQPTTFSADSGSSSIQCVFSDQTSMQAMLTFNVPTSTPTGTYQITVTATVGQSSNSATFDISVISAQVQVSGTVTFNPSGQANGAIAPSGIQFIQLIINSTGGTVKGLTYAGTVSGNSASGYSYSISVPNGQWYAFVIVNSSGTGYAGTDGSHNIDEFIDVQAGSTLTENLSYVNGS